EGLPPSLLHPLLGPVGPHRAGRHGELELRSRGEPRHHRPPPSLQLRDGPRAGHAVLRGPRPQAARSDHRRHPGPRQREQPARLLHALAAAHGVGPGGDGRLVSAGAPALERLLVRQEVEEFLYREAELLDERRFEEWLALFTEDAHYWMPMRRNVPRGGPEREVTRTGAGVNWFDAGKGTLARPVRQLLTSIQCAGEAPSRPCHALAN